MQHIGNYCHNNKGKRKEMPTAARVSIVSIEGVKPAGKDITDGRPDKDIYQTSKQLGGIIPFLNYVFPILGEVKVKFKRESQPAWISLSFIYFNRV